MHGSIAKREVNFLIILIWQLTMETADLDLSTHSDIAILHKIFKTASQERVNFDAVRLSLKHLLKTKQILGIDKYLNFFMIIKSELVVDEPLAWRQLFHFHIRKLERVVLANVTYKKNLLRKALNSWTSLLKIKIMQTYVPSINDKRSTEQVVDPQIKTKAKVFHFWSVYTNLKLKKKQQKSQQQCAILRVAELSKNNTKTVLLKLWKEIYLKRKQTKQKCEYVGQNMKMNRLRSTLLHLKQSKQVKNMNDSIQQKIINSITKLKKFLVLKKLKNNLSTIQKPVILSSYFSFIFLKHLIQKTKNNGPIQYENLHQLIKFKSKARRQFYDHQIKQFYKSLKARVLRAWGIVIQEKNKLVHHLKNTLRKRYLASWKTDLDSSKDRKIIVRKLNKAIIKRSIKKLKANTQNSRKSKTQLRIQVASTLQLISNLRKKKYLIELAPRILKIKQQKEDKAALLRQYYNIKTFSFFSKLIKNVKVNQIIQNAPQMASHKILRKYFNYWVNFNDERDNHMTEIYKFQISYNKKLKAGFINGLKSEIKYVKTLECRTIQVMNILKSRLFLKFRQQIIRKSVQQTTSCRVDLAKKLIYFKRLSNSGKILIVKRKEAQIYYKNALSKHLKKKTLKILKQLKAQTDSKEKRLEEQTIISSKNKLLRNLKDNLQRIRKDGQVKRLRQINDGRYVLNKLFMKSTTSSNSSKKILTLSFKLSLLKKEFAFSKIKMNSDKCHQLVSKSDAIRTILVKKVLQNIKYNTKCQKSHRLNYNKSICNLQKYLNKKKLESLNSKARVYLNNFNSRRQVQLKTLALRGSVQKKYKAQLFSLGPLENKSLELDQILCISKKTQWKFFFGELKEEVKMQKQNDRMMVEFKFQRRQKIIRHTLRSLLLELNRRREALQSISSIFKPKITNSLKHSMNQIFEEYKISFKQSACEKIRKRVGLQRLVNAHFSRQSSKLQEYRSIKHYADNLMQKSFKSLCLCICVATQNDQNAHVLKTVPKSKYIR